MPRSPFSLLRWLFYDPNGETLGHILTWGDVMNQKVAWLQNPQLVPITVGLIGHRKIKDAELDGILAQFDGALAELLDHFRHSPIILLTSLAEGADRIALKSRYRDLISICAVLPFPLEEYKKDFTSKDSIAEFERAIKSVDMVIEPFANFDLIKSDRDLGYRDCANWISDKSNFLMAIWNGKFNKEIGGTGDTISHRIGQEGNDHSSLLINKKFIHIKASNGLEAATEDCSCKGHTPFEKMDAGEMAIFEAFNRDLLNLLDKENSDLETMEYVDKFASKAKKRYLNTSRLTLIAGLATLNLLNLTQINQSNLWFFATIASGLITLMFWQVSIYKKFKEKFENFRIVAEILRIQSWWSHVGLKIKVINHPYVKTDSESWIRIFLSNLDFKKELMAFGSMSELKSEINQTEIKKTSMAWLDGQLEYLAGNGKRLGAIAKNNKSARKFDLVSKIFLFFTVFIFVGNQIFQPFEEASSESVLYQIYSMLIPIFLSISAGSIGYVQLMGFKEISKRLNASHSILSEGLKELELIDQSNTERIEKIVEEIGLESFGESLFWYRLNQSKELRPL